MKEKRIAEMLEKLNAKAAELKIQEVAFEEYVNSVELDKDITITKFEYSYDVEIK